MLWQVSEIFSLYTLNEQGLQNENEPEQAQS